MSKRNWKKKAVYNCLWTMVLILVDLASEILFCAPLILLFLVFKALILRLDFFELWICSCLGNIFMHPLDLITKWASTVRDYLERFLQQQTFSHTLFVARLDTEQLAKYPENFANLAKIPVLLTTHQDLCHVCQNWLSNWLSRVIIIKFGSKKEISKYNQKFKSFSYTWFFLKGTFSSVIF